MSIDERPQLPLTARRKILVATGATLFAAQVIAAWLIAPAMTGPGDASATTLGAAWVASIPISIAAALLLVRQADLPDVATASMLVTIATFAAFALAAAFDVRGSEDEVNMVDALFFGVTSGALTGLVVWALAMAIARILRLPTTERQRPPD